MARDIIVVGLDAMIADLPDAVLAKLQELLDKSLLLADWTTWDLSQCIGEDARDIARVAAQSPEFWENLNNKTGVTRELMRLQQKYDIHIFTNRPAAMDELTRQWLVFNEIPFDEIHHVPSGIEPRIKLAEELGAIAYLDHMQDVCVLASGAGLIAGQLAYPWNSGGDGIVRCRNWAGLGFGVEHKINSLLRQRVVTS